jgi:DNA topoisomerase I
MATKKAPTAAGPPARRVGRLRRSDCSAPGIRRVRRGRGFSYVDEETGDRIADDETLERIRALAIPPAWEEVWICAFPNGHIQAVGTDARGRKQYRYHDRWRERRDREKFDEMLRFARALPQIRETASADLGADEVTRERVLAGATRLLDRGFFRIGGEDYAAENSTYGLATMRKEHVTLLADDVLRFEYPAKGGQERVQSVVDREVYDLVAALKRRRSGGDELLAYRENGSWRDVRSEDINAYIKEVAGEEFSAKDFRTWHATVLAAVALGMSARATMTSSARKRAATRAAKEVAYYLGNTPAVCRSSYIDPRVFDRFSAGVTIAPALESLADDALGEAPIQGPVEDAVVDLLDDD